MFRTWACPHAKPPENASDTSVNRRNNPSGSQMHGGRSGALESSSATRASASRIWEAAMENRMVTAEPKVRYLAALTNCSVWQNEEATWKFTSFATVLQRKLQAACATLIGR